MNKIWQSEEWKKNTEQFLLANPFCKWHGEPVKVTVPHHPRKHKPISDADYLSLKGAIPLCKQCHYAAEKGLKLCSKCKEHYYKPRRGREVCWNCFTQTDFGKHVKGYYEHNRKGETK